MEAFFTSAALVALAEMGDKTQLLAMLLATRFRKPVPVMRAYSQPPLPIISWPPWSAIRSRAC